MSHAQLSIKSLSHPAATSLDQLLSLVPRSFSLHSVLKKHIFTNVVMAQPITCLGHQEREMRRNKIDKLATNLMETLDKNYRVLIKKGPVSVETSLKELEEDYESKPEWKLIKEGGVLSVPVEELRMENLPKPDRSGQVVFKEKRGGGGKQIESYPVGQTIDNINELLREKYDEEKQKAKVWLSPVTTSLPTSE